MILILLGASFERRLALVGAMERLPHCVEESPEDGCDVLTLHHFQLGTGIAADSGYLQTISNCKAKVDQMVGVVGVEEQDVSHIRSVLRGGVAVQDSPSAHQWMKEDEAIKGAVPVEPYLRELREGGLELDQIQMAEL